MTAHLEVLATGPSTSVQDLGRPGLADLGVGPSGAADRGALRLGNRLLAGPEGAAGLEVVLGGLRLRPDSDVLLALTGAACPATVDGRPVGHACPLPVRAGQVLALGLPPRGLRTYVTVRGGLAVAPVLGSRSTDVLAGLGPPLPRPGALLPVGPPPAALPLVDVAPVPALPDGDVHLRLRLGPRDDWFTPAAREMLAGTAWTVTPDSDRVGARLAGPALERAVPGELPSEGLVRGALQVPPSGRPALLLADHPLTGGYPVIAVVLDADVDRAAQARPGQRLRLHVVADPSRSSAPA